MISVGLHFRSEVRISIAWRFPWGRVVGIRGGGCVISCVISRGAKFGGNAPSRVDHVVVNACGLCFSGGCVIQVRRVMFRGNA